MEAALNDHIKVIKALLRDSRIYSNVNDNYVIKWASLNDHTEVVELLSHFKR